MTLRLFVTNNQAANNKTVTTWDIRIQYFKKTGTGFKPQPILARTAYIIPAPNNQFSVFVSMDTGLMLGLDFMQLKINGSLVSNYLWTQREILILHIGGVQRFYIGNPTSGKHDSVSFFVGKGPHNRDC